MDGDDGVGLFCDAAIDGVEGGDRGGRSLGKRRTRLQSAVELISSKFNTIQEDLLPKLDLCRDYRDAQLSGHFRRQI
jgi:hypothetical protein